MYKVYIGWDSREPEAAEVCRHSILRHSTIPVQIEFLKQDVLREQKHYWRDVDEKASTEFSLTRFLVPYLNKFSGHAVFVDCDFVFVSDIRELFQNMSSKFAVQVVKHNYKPDNKVKMDGKEQHQYPRKNWSSLMLFNCSHANCQTLTPEVVNTKTPSYLHRLEWADGLAVGGLNPEWNWLVNWYHEPDDGKPKAIHYTEGGPWFENYRHCEYGWYYSEALNSLKQQQQLIPPPKPLDHLPEDIQALFDKIIRYRIDPAGQYYKDTGLKQIMHDIDKLNTRAAVAVEADTVEEASDKLEAKGQDYDPFLKSFILGSGGQISVWDKTSKDTAPVVLRGVTKRKHMDAARAAGRDFYYIDTGYFGNGRKKTYHRITKNDMQYLGEVRHRPRDRLSQTGFASRKFRPGANILLAPPSQKLLMCYGIDLDQWLEETIAGIRLFTDREIIVRNKQSRSVRQSTDTMEMALERNVHCLVTFSSIAAVEAILLGKPAITLGPSIANSITSRELKDIENPHIPTLDEVEEWAAHVAYCQFTEAEMRDGTAWRILNDDA